MLISMRKYKGFSKTSSMVVSGIQAVMEALNNKTISPDLESPLFLELLACQGGCINGPCATRDSSSISRRMRLLKYAESAADTLDAETGGKNIALTGELTASEMKAPSHTEWEIRSALSLTGNYSVQDEKNCSKCGYENCRAFAAALLEKRAERNMCVTYMRNLAQKKANALFNAIPSGAVIVDKNMMIIEGNKNFARLLGEEVEEIYEITFNLNGVNLRKIADFAHFFEEAFLAGTQDSFDYEIRSGSRTLHLNVYVIEKGETACGVITDITVGQARKDRTVARAKSIIEKNVKAVQQIAFLLGKNAADTEAILHSIIESYKN